MVRDLAREHRKRLEDQRRIEQLRGEITRITDLAWKTWDRMEKIKADIRAQAVRHLQMRAHAQIPFPRHLWTSVSSMKVPEWQVNSVFRAWLIDSTRFGDAVDDYKMFMSQLSGLNAALSAIERKVSDDK